MKSFKKENLLKHDEFVILEGIYFSNLLKKLLINEF